MGAHPPCRPGAPAHEGTADHSGVRTGRARSVSHDLRAQRKRSRRAPRHSPPHDRRATRQRLSRRNVMARRGAHSHRVAPQPLRPARGPTWPDRSGQPADRDLTRLDGLQDRGIPASRALGSRRQHTARAGRSRRQPRLGRCPRRARFRGPESAHRAAVREGREYPGGESRGAHSRGPHGPCAPATRHSRAESAACLPGWRARGRGPVGLPVAGLDRAGPLRRIRSFTGALARDRRRRVVDAAAWQRTNHREHLRLAVHEPRAWARRQRTPAGKHRGRHGGPEGRGAV